jgi:hypothetical protein
VYNTELFRVAAIRNTSQRRLFVFGVVGTRALDVL